MGKYYLIAGIRIKLNYHYDDYFKDNIEQYEIEKGHVDHIIHVYLKDEITYDQSVKENEHTKVIIENDMRIMYAFDKNRKVKGMIKHDLSYKYVDIHIVPSLMKNPAEIEYTLMGLIFLEITQLYGFMPWHASAVVFKDEAILISAPSQTGKSTHAKLWCEVFNDTYILNDDKPLIRKEQDCFLVYSTPFSGKDCQNKNEVKKLKGIVFIKQGKDNHIETFSEASKLKEMMRNVLRPKDESIWDQMLKNMTDLMYHIPMIMIHATLDKEAVLKVHDTLYKE